MTVLCDLDGVVYRGATALPGASAGLQRLAQADVQIFYMTNNSTRTPDAGAEKITRLTGVPVRGEQVLTSSLAAVGLLGPDDGPVLVVGEAGVADAVTRAGLETTDEASDARTVLVGLTRSFTYETLGAATVAVRSGARFIATNADSTFPTEHGLMPGAGAIVAAIATASGQAPEIAGKPHAPMRALIRSQGVTDAWVIGDRVDTDIAIASDEPDWQSILVLTGVTDDVAPDAGADFIVADLSAAVDLVLSHRQPQ